MIRVPRVFAVSCCQSVNDCECGADNVGQMRRSLYNACSFFRLFVFFSELREMSKFKRNLPVIVACNN